jgi:ribosomal protein L3
MSLRADMCRQKATQARQSAAKAKDPAMKREFEELAVRWLQLAEQMQWIDSQEASSPQQKTNLGVDGVAPGKGFTPGAE